MQNLHERTLELYLESGGRDIDAAIERDRRLLELHDRELEHVATLPFDQHYRWRVAPSLMLRAQKDLERQMNRRDELMLICASRARCDGPNAAAAERAEAAAAMADEQAEAIMQQAATLEAALNDIVAKLAANGIELDEDEDAVPRVPQLVGG